MLGVSMPFQLRGSVTGEVSLVTSVPARRGLQVLPMSVAPTDTRLAAFLARGDHSVLLAAVLLQGEERQQHHRDPPLGGAAR